MPKLTWVELVSVNTTLLEGRASKTTVKVVSSPSVMSGNVEPSKGSGSKVKPPSLSLTIPVKDKLAVLPVTVDVELAVRHASEIEYA